MRTPAKYLFPFCIMAGMRSPDLVAAECADLSGSWSFTKGEEYPKLAPVAVKDCEILTRDVIGPWTQLRIGGASIPWNMYGNKLYRQSARATWNKAQTELTIEEHNTVEAGYSPAFGSGVSWFILQKWALDPADPDILHIFEEKMKFNRDSLESSHEKAESIFYRFKGESGANRNADTGPALPALETPAHR